MGCAACCAKSLDIVAPPHKPYRFPPGKSVSSSAGVVDQVDNRQGQAAWSSDFVEEGVDDTGHVSAKCHSFQPPDAELPPSRSSTKEKPDTKTQVTLPNWQPTGRPHPDQIGQALDSTEEAILEEGSDVEGLTLTPWREDDEDIIRNFGLCSLSRELSSGCFFDDAEGRLELSDRQRDALHAWKRFPEIVREGREISSPTVLETELAANSICQGLVGDCSFLSGLSALAEYENRFKDPVLSGIIHPRQVNGDSDARVASDRGPAFNVYGRYGCRLFLNGTTRKVIIDDKVPVRCDGKLLCAHSSCPRELWVTLLEKSFVKIMGSSYDVQGSNPGTDVFHLTGWVPETIPLRVENAQEGVDDDSPSGRTNWDEVFNITSDGYHAGQLVACLGTSELADAAPDDEARRLGHIEGVSISTGLVSRHAYPILDCRRRGQNRLFHLKNPWGRIRWRGRFSPGDSAWNMESLDTPASDEAQVLSGPDPTKAMTDDGHFWIEWEDVLRHFSHLYICWVPRALGLRLEIHSRWDPYPYFVRSLLPDDTHITAFNPQFHLKLHEPLSDSPSGVSIWVLLSRHVRNRSDVSTKYVAVHIYRGGSRLCCPDAPVEQGIYSNGECALVKLAGNKAAGETEFILNVSQHAQKSVFNFTLQVYTSIPGTLKALPPLVPKSWSSGSADGVWRAGTAGGCSNNLWSFFTNPQWLLEVPDRGVSELLLFLECPAEHSLNIRLFSGCAARPEAMRMCNSSGPYRQGCCVLKVTALPSGPHVVIVSTFRPGLVGQYRLSWYCEREVSLKPQPNPFAVPPALSLHKSSCKVSRETPVFFQLRAENDMRKAKVSFHAQCGKDAVFPQSSLCLFKLVCSAPGGPSSMEAVPCELLKRGFAESHFVHSNAVVIVLAELDTGQVYGLQVPADGPVLASEATLYIISSYIVDLVPGTMEKKAE